jgi:hypothetical protein
VVWPRTQAYSEALWSEASLANIRPARKKLASDKHSSLFDMRFVALAAELSWTSSVVSYIIFRKFEKNEIREWNSFSNVLSLLHLLRKKMRISKEFRDRQKNILCRPHLFVSLLSQLNNVFPSFSIAKWQRQQLDANRRPWRLLDHCAINFLWVWTI